MEPAWELFDAATPSDSTGEWEIVKAKKGKKDQHGRKKCASEPGQPEPCIQPEASVITKGKSAVEGVEKKKKSKKAAQRHRQKKVKGNTVQEDVVSGPSGTSESFKNTQTDESHVVVILPSPPASEARDMTDCAWPSSTNLTPPADLSISDLSDLELSLLAFEITKPSDPSISSLDNLPTVVVSSEENDNPSEATPTIMQPIQSMNTVTNRRKKENKRKARKVQDQSEIPEENTPDLLLGLAGVLMLGVGMWYLFFRRG